MTQKVVLRNEVVKVKGRVKAVTVPKEDFDKFLKLTKIRVLDKEYEALMPPIENLMKNTIDVNGLAQLLQYYFTAMIYNPSGNPIPTNQMVLQTSSGSTVSLQYSSSISLNSQGMVVFMQVFEVNGLYNFQYYYVGFDTTSSQYTVTQAELYVSILTTSYYHGQLARIAYSNIGLTKTSSEYLFLVWLIEFENIPPYLSFFVPIFQNPLGIEAVSGSSVTIYFNNGNCGFYCGGSCPSSKLNGFIIYVQNNSVVVEFPIQSSLGTGVTNLEVMLCTSTSYTGLPTISGYTSTTLTPPVSGATIYVGIATITITYQVS